jgi:hypothetical protein
MNKILQSGLAEDKVDGLLVSFFKREMPAPWPEAKVPAVSGAIAYPRFWLRSYSRLVLVASVALILFGYLLVAAMFPVESEPGLNINRHQTIGNKPGLPVPTPGQRPISPRPKLSFQ